MAISIVKKETDKIIHDKDSILTPLYGKINIVDKINSNEYTYFDTVDGYDLFIDNNADTTVAVKSEGIIINEDTDSNSFNIDEEINKIIETYDVDKVKFVDSDEPAIMIKVNAGKEEVLLKIMEDYKDNATYTPNKVTSNVLFLDLINHDIQLEDDDLLNHLDDSAIKDLASKTGAKLTGSESKDELKGIVKGALSNSNK